MATPINEFEGAQRILSRYYRELARRMAEEIIEHREDFESPGFGGRAESIIDKYGCQLNRLEGMYSNLKQFATRENAQTAQSLGKDEFRCFSCGGLIRRGEETCGLCGWTWK